MGSLASMVSYLVPRGNAMTRCSPIFGSIWQPGRELNRHLSRAAFPRAQRARRNNQKLKRFDEFLTRMRANF